MSASNTMIKSDVQEAQLRSLYPALEMFHLSLEGLEHSERKQDSDQNAHEGFARNRPGRNRVAVPLRPWNVHSFRGREPKATARLSYFPARQCSSRLFADACLYHSAYDPKWSFVANCNHFQMNSGYLHPSQMLRG